jgi:LytTr DNA-binding domain
MGLIYAFFDKVKIDINNFLRLLIQNYTMLKFLSQPYPIGTDFNKIVRQNFWIGCFIAFFLIVFQPFDSDKWLDEYKYFKLAGYGVVSFLMPTMINFYTFKISNIERTEEKWTVGREILMLSVVLLAIVFGNLLYGNFLGVMSMSLSSFVGSLISVLLIGFFPIMARILLNYNRFKELNQKDAKILEGDLVAYQAKNQAQGKAPSATVLQTVQLFAENEKDSISLIINDLLYIESADNYSNIVFWQGKKIQRTLLRGPLKRFEQQLSAPLIQRCHRSYIVNLQHCEQINGNAQGYRISLKSCEEVIPVARNYGAVILEKLRS